VNSRHEGCKVARIGNKWKASTAVLVRKALLVAKEKEALYFKQRNLLVNSNLPAT
jgi:hypothetical protein